MKNDREADVMWAINRCCPTRFVKVTNVAKHILGNIADYPTFWDCNTNQTAAFRVTTQLTELNWPRFTKPGNRNSVFINPNMVGDT
jgi:hypothetical protein